MGNLVAKHNSELGFILCVGQQSSRDIYVASGQGKCVYDWTIEHPKREFRFPKLLRRIWLAKCTLFEDATGNPIDVRPQFFVLIDAVTSDDLFVGLLAKLLLFFPAVPVEPSIPGDGAAPDCAACHPNEKQEQRPYPKQKWPLPS